MHANGRHHFVGLGINHADVIGIGVRDINLILPRICRYACRTLANVDRGEGAQSTKINNGYSIASTIGDVSVFVVVRARLRRAGAAAKA